MATVVMIGVSLSRWTMSYFAVALVALLGAELLMVAGFGFPSQPVAAPQTLVRAHLVAIGWLSLLGPGQALRLLATFEPLPLYRVLAKKGFDHTARHEHGGRRMSGENAPADGVGETLLGI